MRRKTLVAVGAIAALCAGTSTSAGAVTAPAIARIHTAAASEAVQLPSNWLAQMNGYRANYGVPNVVEEPALSAADAEHVHWMAVNDTMMHGETPGTPSYTAAGDLAGKRSNLSMGSTDAIGGWMAAPFHALGILRPTLQRTGYAFNPDGNWAALDVLSRSDGPAPATTRFPMTWPTSRSPVALLSYSGNESPDPVAGCGQISSSGWGLPLIASFGYNRNVRVKSADLRTSTGHVVPVCLRDASSYANVGSDILKEWGTVLVIPRERLSLGTHYTGSVTTDAGTAPLDFWTAPNPQQVQRYVTRVYFDLFNRVPDATGLVGWTNRLNSGTPRVAVANAITSSTEYRSKLIAGSYAHYLLRAPDAVGLRNWLAAMNRGITISQMESGFIASSEYFAKAGNTNSTWVTKLYSDVLGRAASPAEVAKWTAQLNAGTVSRTKVAMGFLLSSERLSTVVNGYYQQLLGRGIDPVGRAGWVAILQRGGRNENIIGGIIASGEYWSRN
jgi:Domain of unknown function (DUF4214)/Cysteine-rich secretory protein family